MNDVQGRGVKVDRKRLCRYITRIESHEEKRNKESFEAKLAGK